MSKRVYHRYVFRRKVVFFVSLAIIGGVCFVYGWWYFSQPARVEITSAPGDALIELAGVEQATGELVTTAPAGEYTLTVTRPGFAEHSESVELKANKLFGKQINLKPNTYSFSLQSDPEGADYEITLPDGSKRNGELPFVESLSAGQMQVKLTLEGYQDLAREFFLDQDSDQIWRLDQPDQLLLSQRTIGPVPSPKGVDFSPNGSEIWVTSLMNPKAGVFVFNAKTGEQIKSINLNDQGGVEVIFSPDGSKAYVSQMESGTIYEIDAENYEILRELTTDSTWCKVMEFSPDGNYLYVANWSGNNVSKIYLKSGEVELIPTVGTPRGLYATADGRYLYVAGFDKGEIEKINLDDGSSEILLTTGGAMRHFVADEDRNILFASDMADNSIFKIDLTTDEVTKFATTDNNPNTIALTPDGKVLFVSNRGVNAAESYYVPGPEWGSIQVFDTTTGEMLDAVVGGNQPTALAVSKDGRYLVYSNFLDADLELYEIPSYEELVTGDGGRSEVYKKELIK